MKTLAFFTIAAAVCLALAGFAEAKAVKYDLVSPGDPVEIAAASGFGMVRIDEHKVEARLPGQIGPQRRNADNRRGIDVLARVEGGDDFSTVHVRSLA